MYGVDTPFVQEFNVRLRDYLRIVSQYGKFKVFRFLPENLFIVCAPWARSNG